MLFLILIFSRPFISSLGFIYANAAYSSLLMLFLLAWLWRKGLPLQEIKPLKWPLLLFIAALAVSVLFSQDRLSSFRELYKYLSGIFLFLFCLRLSAEEKNKTINTLIAAGLIIALLAIYQYLFGFAWLSQYTISQNISRPFVADLISRKRVFFPFVTANTLAGYLAMIIFLALGQWNNRSKILSNPAFYILAIIFSALILSKSIGAFFSLLLASLILLKGGAKKKELLLFVLLALITAAILISRAATLAQHTHPLFSTTMRLSYWKETLKIIAAHPWFGVGLGNFNIAQARYAHNSYLQLCSEMGILGIISFLWLVTAIIKSSLRNIAVSPQKRKTAALFAATAVFLIHNIVDFSFFLPESAFIWWIVLGLF